MKNPLVSIIIPVYNMGKIVAETINSVLESDYNPFEIIIVDDGSTDDSFNVIQKLAIEDSRIQVFLQENQGVSVARNTAINHAKGKYILPVDSDNLIVSQFIPLAVNILEKQPNVKVVRSLAEFFGEKNGDWITPEFNIKTIAHKNIIDACAVYRKSDWERIGGYCESIKSREDWDFWISMLKDGGDVVRIAKKGLYYRTSKNSKRIRGRKLKRPIIDALNARHPEFFEEQLNGRLRYHRSTSKFMNILSHFFHYRKYEVNEDMSDMKYFIKALVRSFDKNEDLIFKNRNELKAFNYHDHSMIVKSFRTPHLFNRFIYRFFRSSKAERSYRYAKMLREAGIDSPEPIGYLVTGSWFLIKKSYYDCKKSECPYTYRDFAEKEVEHRREMLLEIGKTIGRMHNKNWIHNDLSAGNILCRWEPGKVTIELIDLNRIRFHRINIEKGCKNFNRLRGDKETYTILAEGYAQERGYNKDECLQMMLKARNIKYQ